MKRLVLFIMMVASVIRAEAYHWTPNSGPYASTMTAIGIIEVDGEERNVPNLEIGAFCGDECRGREMPIHIASQDRYMVFLTIYGNDGDTLRFRLYDANLGEELVLNSLSEMTFVENAAVGTVGSPYVFAFETVTYPIEAEANPEPAGTVTGAGIYGHGSMATLTATANEGYQFLNWTQNGTIVSTEQTYSFEVTGAASYVANFELQITDTTAYTCDAFEWHGHTYTSNGIYYDTLTSYLGLDSIVALHLTVYPSYHYEYTVTECGNYFWEDVLYTESGDYTREYQSVYGCDSTLALHLTLLPLRLLGNFTYLSPANNYIVRYTDMDFYWDAIPNANSYDFYIWQGEGGRPDTPTLSNTTSHSYQVGGLTHGTTYHWCVVAKNECQESESDTRTFTCQLNPAMAVVPNGWMDFGEVELGQSRTKTVSVSGTALTEDISVAFLDNAWGQDAGFFEVAPSNWNSLSGGLLHITFVPEPTQLYYSAAIRIASGAFADTVYFTGTVANRYVFTTEVAGEVYSANDEIVINGHVEDVLGNPVSDMGVNVYLMVMGTKFTLPTNSDANGNYSVTYTPRYSETGFYQVGSCAYGTTSNEVHDAFDIPGMSRVSSDFVVWTPYQDETLTGTIEIRNRSRLPITNIQVNTISLPDGCTVSFSGVTNLGPLETGQLNYTVTGTQVSEGSNYEEATFEVTANDGLTMNMTCYYYCRQRRGDLEVYPPSIVTTMKRYDQKALSFQITNNGNGETGPITVSLPDVEWMSLMGGNTLESLQVGDSCAFSILLMPDENVSLVQYSGSIAVNCANGNGISIPYTIEATSDSTGMLVVDVTDDYTYNTNGGNGPHLAGAEVYLKGYYSLEMVAQGMTDENGIFTVENVPEGYYYLTIHATQHKSYDGAIIYVEGGKTNHQDIYLQYQAISYSWVVVPTEIQDQYEFELVAEIKTNVPVPVITVDCPKKIDTLAYGDTIQFNLTVTNHGLIDAYDTQLTMPTEYPEYDFIPMIDFIDTIHAKTSIVIPCIVTRTHRNRTSGGGDHCHLGKGRTVSFYYCNAQRQWVRFEFALGFRVICDYTPEELPKIDPPTPPPPPQHCDSCSYPYPPHPVGPDVPIGPVDPWWPWHSDTTQFNPQIPISTPSQDCTPCWKLIPSIIGNVAGYLIGVPAVGTLADDLIYARENVEMLSDFADAVTSDPKSLLSDNRDQLDDLAGFVISNALSLKSVTVATIAAVAGIVLTAKSFLDHVSDCITFSDPYRDTPELGTAIDQLSYYTDYYESLYNYITNLFQEEEWQQETNLVEFLDNFIPLVDSTSYLFPPQATNQLIELSGLTYVDDSIVQRFVERWNRSIQYWSEGIYTLADLPEGYSDNFIKLDNAIVQPALDAMEAVQAYGFDGMNAMTYHATSVMQDAVTEHKTDVCAKVSVSFKQTMTMTREAFEGTLKIFNGHATDPMQDIDVNIVIKDYQGVDRTDLFQINVTSLSDITGVDGTGTLDAQTEGIAQFTMIPTIEAAPDTTKVYSFGGSFSFIDPFSGTELTYDLYPVKLKVNPGPNLHVDYFISRHLISDDPLTEDTIEATEPAELAMMISNVGAGNANNVYLESSQPQIIDNQNGLLISFDLVGAAMNGVQRPLGLIDIPFGTIESHSAGIAEWYFTSSLMARVIHSTPHVIHNNSYGNPNLSLVTELNSHDLIKAITAYGSLEDGINDFLVNDTPDFDHTPDKIYFSHGGTATVKRTVSAQTQGELSTSNNTVLLTLNPNSAGWNYACLDDPGQGQYELISCTRDDGQEIPLSNVWVSHVTMFDDDAPVHENKLHIVDTLSVSQTTTYTLVYANTLYGNITVAVNPTNSGTVTGAGTYEYSTICTLTATANEGYAFVNWTTTDGEEVSTEAAYSFTVTGDAAFVANFELTAITQSDGFSQGWNWWSTYVEADDLLEQMENSLGIHGVTVKSQNGYVQYMPDFNIWYGSPGFGVYNEYCYLIQTTADCDVEVTGAQASPTNHPITLSFGWNWIGFPCTAHQSFETAFSGIVPRDGDIVKSQTQGFASYMSAFNIWYGTLADYGIDPGMGLLYRSFNGETFTFTYPESRGEEPKGNDFTENNHWTADYHAYPNNMTVIAIVELDDVEVNSENYELAAFANGECRGSVKLMHVAPLNRYMAFLTVAGDEASELRFSLYDVETGTVETECLATLQYETDATIGSFESPYVVRFRNTTGVDELGSRINVFPNPVARGEKVNIDLKADNFGKMRIEIVNALGEVVETVQSSSVQTITAPEVAGVYTLRITVDGEGTCCRKLVVK